MYTAIVLDADDQAFLKERFSSEKPGWELQCHHLTFHLGPMTDEERKMEGQSFLLFAEFIGRSDLAIAYKVEHIHNCERTPFQRVVLDKPNPHVTLLVNRAGGGKPKDSNDITEWVALPKPIILKGRLREVA